MSPQSRVRMPSLDRASDWLNTEPLGPGALRGHVVLVSFWTLTCINWLRTAPYVRAWSRAYRDDGLVVVGVHTPEFSFEQRIDLVRHAVARYGIDYPVVIDNGYSIWNAFDNHYWPALYFVDDNGAIRGRHFGEGSYAESERFVQRLIGVERELVAAVGTGLEADADWVNLHSPETYLGRGRGERFASPGGAAHDGPRHYDLPDRLRVHHWGLSGEWAVGSESVVLTRSGGSIAFRFHARDAHLVLSTAVEGPIEFRVLLDGEPPGAAHGDDVGADGAGLLSGGRLYGLVRQRDQVRERTVQVSFLAPGAEAYAFTFG